MGGAWRWKDKQALPGTQRVPGSKLNSLCIINVNSQEMNLVLKGKACLRLGIKMLGLFSLEMKALGAGVLVITNGQSKDGFVH